MRLRALIPLLCAVAIALFAASAALADSITVVLPAHMQIGKPFSFTLKGTASSTDILLFTEDSAPCASAYLSELVRKTDVIYVVGQPVHGQFTIQHPVGGLIKGHTGQYFCAYLGLKSGTTAAHVALTAHVPR